jgi:cytochrome c oxidase cbb3-type subunit 3
MSDFVNSGWSVFIATVTILGLVGCLLLLLIASRRKVRPGQPDDNTTGHVWDGDLRELNNPLPLWWMGLFVITLAFAAGYLFLYPGLGHYAGSLGWTPVASTSRRSPRPTPRSRRSTRPMQRCPSSNWPRTRRPWPSASACS